MTTSDSISSRANTLAALQKHANFYVSQRNGHKCHPSISDPKNIPMCALRVEGSARQLRAQSAIAGRKMKVDRIEFVEFLELGHDTC